MTYKIHYAFHKEILTMRFINFLSNNVKIKFTFINSHISLFFSAMAGVASNVCFMALRDLDENKNYIYPAHTNIKYDWTFMTSWIGTGSDLRQVSDFLWGLRFPEPIKLTAMI
jgi:hypothetical protein